MVCVVAVVVVSVVAVVVVSVAAVVAVVAVSVVAVVEAASVLAVLVLDLAVSVLDLAVSVLALFRCFGVSEKNRYFMKRECPCMDLCRRRHFFFVISEFISLNFENCPVPGAIS